MESNSTLDYVTEREAAHPKIRHINIPGVPQLYSYTIDDVKYINDAYEGRPE